MFNEAAIDDAQELERVAKDTTIFIDTSALLEPGAERVLLKELAGCLTRVGRKACVLSRTVDYLEDCVKKADSPDHAAARRALQIVGKLQAQNLLDEAADTPDFKEPGFTTRRMLVLMFLRYQISKHQTLITNDEITAQRIHTNARLGAIEVSAKAVNLYCVGGHNLQPWAPLLASDDAIISPHSASSTRDLKTIAQKCKVVVDTCSLMRCLDDTRFTAAVYFTEVLLPLMREAGNSLIVPARVVRELKVNQSKPGTAVAAAAGLRVLDAYEAAGLLALGEDQHELGGTSKNFADPVFIQLAIMSSASQDLCFITQDTNLAIALIANRESTGDRATHVVYLEDRSLPVGLEAWEPSLKRIQKRREADLAAGRAPLGKAPRRESRPQHQTTPQAAPERSTDAPLARTPETSVTKFALAEHPRRDAGVSLGVTRVPGVGDTVIGAKTGRIQLGRLIAAGGEGSVFETPDPSAVCKIYFAEQLTSTRRDKLDLMLSRPIRIRGVCWPSEIVSNPQGEFVGYLMPKGAGKVLMTAVFAKKLLLRNFPHWTRDHLNQLAITILETIESLHRLNIFIGDINAQNILVCDERTISLVDLDSAQIEGFPCPVGTDTFTPAHRQGQSWSGFLRSSDDELFAVTTLLFMILFPGKAPYTSQGGGDAAENIRAHRFAYGRNAEGRPPVGVWQFIWTHLRRDLQQDFVEVFQLDKRLSIGALIKHLRQEQRDIRDGKRNADIFPDKPRLREGDTEEVLCAQCPPGKNLHTVSRAAAEGIRERGLPWHCNACRAMRKMTHLENSREVECASHLSPDCEGKTSAAINYLDMLESKGREFRCRPCQAAHREVNQKRKGQACFVATATYRSENAEPVMFLRAYRDAVLAQSLAGRAFIHAYYAIGPLLARPVMHSSLLRRFSKAILDRWIQRLDAVHPELNQHTRDIRHE